MLVAAVSPQVEDFGDIDRPAARRTVYVFQAAKQTEELGVTCFVQQGNRSFCKHLELVRRPNAKTSLQCESRRGVNGLQYISTHLSAHVISGT